jgi:hypothetical protein
MDLGTAADRIEAERAERAGREVHDARTASILGIALGASFTVCLLTGVYSHLHQQPPSWFDPTLGPAGLYRFTQGLHVITGLASVPLLLAKLYSVSPQLLRRPLASGRRDVIERLGILPLVGGSIFLVVTGTANIAHWYPWPFFFPVAHWWAAWLVVGAVLTHVAWKARTTRSALRRDGLLASPPPPRGALGRRGLLVAAGSAAGLVTLVTAGQTVPGLTRLTLLAPRRPDIGPQGFPVNRSAEAAGTTDLADDPDYRLVVAGPSLVRSFGLDELRALPMTTAVLPIACVEGWSASATWEGVRVRDLLAAAGAEPSDLVVRSAQRAGLYGSSALDARAAAGDECLLALRVNGEPLHPDHGAPVRLIAPNRPGVLQTKWVVELELS